MKRFMKRNVISGFFLGVMALSAPALAFAQEKPIEWRYYTAHTADREVFKLETDWANMINEATDGRLKVVVYPGGALGFKESDMLGALKNGLVESSYVYAGYYGRSQPVLPLVLPQMVFNTRDEFLSLLPTVYEAYEDLYADWDVKVASMWPTSSCHITVIAKEEFNTLDSLKGKRVRVWEAQQVNSLRAVDVVGTVVPQNDIYLAFKTGMIDAIVHYPEALRTLSLAEDAKYFSLLQPVPVVQGIGISERAFNALPADLQEIVQSVSDEHRSKWAADSKTDCKEEQQHLEWAAENGVERSPDFSESDRNKLSEAAIEVWRARAEQVGGEAEEIQKRIEDALMKLRNG
ncbi:TRAP transporter substrate-binding protein DctP [Paenalcaligenes niemegkensis]|uniref:TRAP transporter substrate-binding protein n=1 Tax=Paenalcaligenes niemegkensis TaxID=2895469 RepID=UPI001EE7BF81|nr:TRAP transporter substrate-binding protein DctP [Paenalcaligenes niemegkensis]MCQ9617443.1 TRAP transporter substrate-binding protein DctP [Paenalcaligenes niemegkensis]